MYAKSRTGAKADFGAEEYSGAELGFENGEFTGDNDSAEATELIGKNSVQRLPPYDKLPKFIHGIGLSCAEKILYCELFNTVMLSLKNGVVDRQGRAYTCCSQNTLAKKLEISRSTVSLSLRRLEQAGLIMRKENKISRVVKIYVGFYPKGLESGEGGSEQDESSGENSKNKSGSDGCKPESDEYGESRKGKYGSDDRYAGSSSNKRYGTYGSRGRIEDRYRIPPKLRYGYSFEELEELDEFA